MDTFTNEYRTNNEKEFYINQRLLGATTSPQSANQIQEATSRLNAGVKHIELELISPDLFDSVPKQHFEEMRRMSNLTGSSINIHAPAQMDLAGFGTKQGDEQWSESQRKNVEESMKHMIDRGADLGNNTVVNFHSSGGVRAFEWQKEKIPEEEKIPPGEKRKIYVIDQADSRHQIVPLEYEEKQHFGGMKPWTPEVRRDMINKSQWDQEKLQLFNYEKEKAEIMDRYSMVESRITPLEAGKNKEILNNEELKMLNNLTNQKKVMDSHIEEINIHMGTQLEDMHDKFYRFALDKDKKEFLRSYGSKYEELVNLSKNEKKEMENLSKFYNKKAEKIIDKNGDMKSAEPELRKIKAEFYEEMEKKKVSREELLNIIQEMPAPERFVTTDEFAQKKLSDTVANSALYAYDKYKDKAPVISVENVFPDWTLGRADSLRKAIEESRNKFAKRLNEEKKVPIKKAEEIAGKLIGATWDVGHITQLRKFGYSDEDIAKEAQKIAPVVKHIHVTDNFGFSDSHLAPGQGTVPIKEQLAKLKAGLGKEYDKVAHIVESGGFASQFKTSPRMQELQYFNSPLYEMKAGPYWRDLAYTNAEYSMGYGLMFPEKHFELYGSGFSNLPQELGGQVSNERSRFSGTPND